MRIASSNGEVKRLVVAGEVAFGLTDTDDAHDAVSQGAPVRVVYPWPSCARRRQPRSCGVCCGL